ncbi:protein CNPPD1 [Drosophila miranda]|uniref:protein CNPPD1 n=1 Tax=Drosophila miranda TaxID=7229 RepID=UPI0007E8A925|nr:protein CNPPD1 [Drosophila miranda]
MHIQKKAITHTQPRGKNNSSGAIRHSRTHFIFATKMGRSKFAPAKKVMQHDEFMNRIRKTLYYGVGTADSEMEVSMPFAEYASEIFSEPHRGHSLHRLSCVTAGKIQTTTPCSLIMALIYLDRLNVIDPGYGYRITPQELFVVSLMISTKFYAGHDEKIYLEDWAKEGNMTEARLKEMELEFLSAIDWNIYISNEQFFAKLSSVERTLAEREGLRRGWLTYSELMQLLPSFTWMKFLLNSITVMALSYAASVITLAGAFFIASQVPGTLWHRRTPTNDVASTANSTTLTTPASAPDATQAAPVISNEMNSSQANESCGALNVEAELLKLEQQYCDEARLNEMENNPQRFVRSVPNLPLKTNNRKPEMFAPRDNADHWLSIKSEYSDSRDNPNYWISGHGNRHHDDLDHWQHQAQNASVFWQLVKDAVQTSFLVRWPEIWPKLI